MVKSEEVKCKRIAIFSARDGGMQIDMLKRKIIST